jgi:GDSL-like Lipase/Acylhydrolase family
MQDAFPNIDVPDEFISFKYPLPHFAEALLGKALVRIVAMGSSSTAGREDVVPYPHRLEMYLRAHFGAEQFPDLRIDVLNRGRGGEEAGDELKRFERDIFAEKPSLVIWQVGTNAVFHGDNIDQAAADIATGLQRLRGEPMDVVLVDPQYTPAMLFDGKAEASERIVSLISAAAHQAKVNLFRRWALMRHWHVHNNVGFDLLFDPTDKDDRLHQSDQSTLLVAKALRDAIIRAPAAQG